MCADWEKHGEAGSYVEQYAGGGIMGFNVSRDDGVCASLFFLPSFVLTFLLLKQVFIQTDADNFWSPSTPFLFSLRHRGFAHFIPGVQDMPMPHPPITLRIPTAPSIPASSSRPCTFISDSCDAAEGMSALANIVRDIPKHSGDRILAPSGMFLVITVCIVTTHC